MKIEDAKPQTRLLRSKRDRDGLTNLDVVSFYEELRRDPPELFNFKYSGLYIQRRTLSPGQTHFRLALFTDRYLA